MRRENVRRMKKKKEMRKRFLSVISTTKNKIKKLIKKNTNLYWRLKVATKALESAVIGPFC